MHLYAPRQARWFSSVTRVTNITHLAIIIIIIIIIIIYNIYVNYNFYNIQQPNFSWTAFMSRNAVRNDMFCYSHWYKDGEYLVRWSHCFYEPRIEWV